MKKKFALFGVVAIALLSFCFAVFLGGNPSNAFGHDKYQALISAGVIKSVVEPSELGLGYLREEPPKLAADNRIVSIVEDAAASVAQMPEDMALGVVLCTEQPLTMLDLHVSGSICANLTFGRVIVAVGILDRNGKPRNITPKLSSKMFDAELKNSKDPGNFPDDNVIDIVYKEKGDPSKEKHVLKKIKANAFCRNLVNGAVTGSLERGNGVV